MCPHPDDETLGCGGLIATQRQRGGNVTVIAASDGDAAYPDQSPCELAVRRRREHRAALAHLGVQPGATIRAGLPDGRLRDHEAALVTLIRRQLARSRRQTLLVAPWPHDGHPDHEACGRAATTASGDRPLVFYVIWGWNRTDPVSLALRPGHLLEFGLDRSVIAARARALAEHRSQLYVEAGQPIVSAQMAADLLVATELYVARDSDTRAPIGSTSRTP